MRLVAVLLLVALPGCGLKAQARTDAERLRVAGTASPASSPSALASPVASLPPSPAPPSAPPAASPTAAPAPSPEPRDPLALVGRWHVDGPGIAAGTALVLGEELHVFLRCGVLDGTWEADGPQGLFVAMTYGGDSACYPAGQDPSPDWLDDARSFAVEGEQRTLRDAAGTVLVRLRPGARPTVGPNRSDQAAAEPQLTPRLRERLAEPAPLPPGAEPISAAQLQRRWVPVDVANPKVELVFAADGRYSGSDGCNGEGGRYALGRQGRLVGIGGPSTAIGCDGAPVGSWVDRAGRAALVDGELVLYDADAQVLGRLRPGS